MIAFSGLQKVSGGATVIDIPDFKLAEGEVAALVGSPGSGEQALLDLLIGRTRPTAGSLRIAGLDPAVNHEQFGKRVGVLFAEDSVYKFISPLANLEFYGQLHGLPPEQAAHTLAQVGLADQAGARMDKLTPGLLRRLDFGRAILHNPDVLILVDPFARCDENTVALLGGLIRQKAADGGAVLIFANDLAQVTPICDIIYTLTQGHLVEIDQPRPNAEGYMPFKVPVRFEEKVILFNPVDILYAEASADRAWIVTAEGRLPTQFTLSELDSRLTRSGFFRAHRSYLVNLQHIKEVIPYTRNSYSLRLDDPARTVIPLSRSAAGELKDLLGF